MSKHQKNPIQPLTGEFVGWGDDRTPHRYIKLHTITGERVVKVAKRLRAQIQDWQPGMWLTLLGQERVNLATGETKIKVTQVLVIPRMKTIENSPTTSAEPLEDLPVINAPLPSIQIKVCQGSSCRRRGSEGICKAMQTYFDLNDLTVGAASESEHRVEIKSVKCLHQCKAAPHAIITQPGAGDLPEKTHYRQLQNYQVQAILAKHFPLSSSAKANEDNLIKKIGNYLQQIGSTSTIAGNPNS